MKEIIEKLKTVNTNIFAIFGVESYIIRCALYDICKELEEYKEPVNEDNVYNKLADINGLEEVGANRWKDKSGLYWYLTKHGFKLVDGKV